MSNSFDKPSFPFTIAIVGLGKRALTRAIPAIIQLSELFHLEIGCDKDESARQKFTFTFATTPCVSTVEEVILWRGALGNKVQCAYVAVPHSEHQSTVTYLLQAGIHVLKEKPASLSKIELQGFHQLAERQKVRLVTACQGRYSERFSQLKAWLPFVGDVQFFEGFREVYCSDLGEGWRAEKVLSGGGVLFDLGWHLLDATLGLLMTTVDSEPIVTHSELLFTRSHQKYDVEDTAFMYLEFPRPSANTTAQRTPCHLKTSRVGSGKKDSISITGSDGILTAEGDSVSLKYSLDSGRREMTEVFPAARSLENMFRSFFEEIKQPEMTKHYQRYAQQDLAVVSIIEKVYKQAIERQFFLDHPDNVSKATTSGREYPTSQHSQVGSFEWPIITTDVREEVIVQLHNTISIYGNDGIFQEFEQEFRVHLQQPTWYSLVHNSGSNALGALYYACDLRPGDEVIFPVYTFHATCSPAMHFGIKPIFVDITDVGTMSATALRQAITPSTKAVMISHMWGIPCDIVALQEVLKNYQQVLLLEDCSHAHGASIAGQPVGTFGDGAAWSLQGQKIISGGEGGIVVTKHREFHFRQLIWGHYNKRCRAEIPEEHPLWSYALTGVGLKNRAHPLAIKIALNQLRKLSDFQKYKAEYSRQILQVVQEIPFLDGPQLSSIGSPDVKPAWYVLWFRFKAHLAPHGLTREKFVEDLHTSGLNDVDIPSSTCLLHAQPLFTHPRDVLPAVYRENPLVLSKSGQAYPEAEAFFRELIKVPVWAYKRDQSIVDVYVSTLRKYCVDPLLQI